MAFTSFTGPVRSGTVREGSGRNAGVAVLTQTTTFAYTDTGAFATTIILPAGSQIIQMFVDVTTAWNSVTSDALEIGTSGDPDAYGDVADLQTAGRSIATVDATQAAAIDNIGTSDVTIYLKITSAGGSLSAGAAVFTVTYAQKASDGSANPASA